MIKKHMASLDEQSKLILEMKYIFGMTYNEISNETGLTVRNIGTKLLRAKAKLYNLATKGGVPDDK